MNTPDSVGTRYEGKGERVGSSSIEHGGKVGKYVGTEDFDDDRAGDSTRDRHVF